MSVQSFVPIHLENVNTLHIRVSRSRPLGPTDVCKKAWQSIQEMLVIPTTITTDRHKALLMNVIQNSELSDISGKPWFLHKGESTSNKGNNCCSIKL